MNCKRKNIFCIWYAGDECLAERYTYSGWTPTSCCPSLFIFNEYDLQVLKWYTIEELRVTMDITCQVLRFARPESLAEDVLDEYRRDMLRAEWSAEVLLREYNHRTNFSKFEKDVQQDKAEEVW